jgi:hypothetical protein
LYVRPLPDEGWGRGGASSVPRPPGSGVSPPVLPPALPCCPCLCPAPSLPTHPPPVHALPVQAGRCPVLSCSTTPCPALPALPVLMYDMSGARAWSGWDPSRMCAMRCNSGYSLTLCPHLGFLAMAFPRGLSRTGANSIASCSPLTLLFHLGFLAMAFPGWYSRARARIA